MPWLAAQLKQKGAFMKKTIYALPSLREVLQAANQRYLKFISAIATPEVGVEKLHRLAETQNEPKGQRTNERASGYAFIVHAWTHKRQPG